MKKKKTNYPTLYKYEQNGKMADLLERFPEKSEYKNWKAFCDALEVFYPVRGKSMDLLKARLQLYFDVEKIPGTYKIIVTKKNTTIVHKHRGNKGKYSPLIREIILQLLACEENCTRVYTKNQLWTELGMQNRKIDNYRLTDLKEKNKEITKELIEDFRSRKHKAFKDITDRALSRLEKDSLIKHEEVVMIVKRKGMQAKKANKKDKDRYETAFINVAHDMGYPEKNIGAIKNKLYLKKEDKKFFSKLDEEIKTCYGWYACFEAIKIIGLDKTVIFDRESISKHKKELNKLIISKMKDNTIASWNSYIKKRKEYISKYEKKSKSLVLGGIAQPLDSYLEDKMRWATYYVEHYVDIENQIAEYFLEI